MQRRPALEVVLQRRLVVAHLLAAEDEALLDRGDAFFLFHALFYLGDLGPSRARSVKAVEAGGSGEKGSGGREEEGGGRELLAGTL